MLCNTVELRRGPVVYSVQPAALSRQRLRVRFPSGLPTNRATSHTLRHFFPNRHLCRQNKVFCSCNVSKAGVSQSAKNAVFPRTIISVRKLCRRQLELPTSIILRCNASECVRREHNTEAA